jgi:hypothetical protein
MLSAAVLRLVNTATFLHILSALTACRRGAESRAHVVRHVAVKQRGKTSTKTHALALSRRLKLQRATTENTDHQGLMPTTCKRLVVSVPSAIRSPAVELRPDEGTALTMVLTMSRAAPE